MAPAVVFVSEGWEIPRRTSIVNAPLQAVGDTLHFQCDAVDIPALERSKYVVSDHLARFGRKENPELVWNDRQPL